jgi:hypothetical protein
MDGTATTVRVDGTVVVTDKAGNESTVHVATKEKIDGTKVI